MYVYQTEGTCSQEIYFDVTGDILTHVEFVGGCRGNLQGISRLVTGMAVQDVIQRLRDIDCGGKGTSCPDQLALALQAYIAEKQQDTAKAR